MQTAAWNSTSSVLLLAWGRLNGWFGGIGAPRVTSRSLRIQKASVLAPVPTLFVIQPLVDERPPLRGVFGMEDAAEDSVGGGAEGDGEVEEPVDGPRSAGRWGCGQAVLDFLSSTDVGRLVPPLEEGDARSEVSGWELRERWEREEERGVEAEALGV